MLVRLMLQPGSWPEKRKSVRSTTVRRSPWHHWLFATKCWWETAAANLACGAASLPSMRTTAKLSGALTARVPMRIVHSCYCRILIALKHFAPKPLWSYKLRFATWDNCAVFPRSLALALAAQCTENAPLPSVKDGTGRARWRQTDQRALNPRQESHDQPLRCHLSQHSEPGRERPL